MRICIFDPRMGVSGDMIVGALIDCGADEKKVLDAMETAGNTLERTEITLKKVEKCGVASTSIDVRASLLSRLKSTEMKKALEEALRKTGVKNKPFARKCLDTLLEAEGIVHGVSPEELVLHETGSADTLCDIVGATVACETLCLFECEILSTPIVTGFGYVKTHHGTLPIPAPATSEILKGCIIEAGSIEGELTTPTGASLLKNLISHQVPSIPLMRLEKTGYGAGKKDFHAPNVLRIFLGEKEARKEEIVILETNLDDVSGEVLGNAVTHLECLDFAIIPTTTKKNRPGFILQVLCEKGKEGKMAEEIFEKTGSLGIRVFGVERFVFEREIKKTKVEGEGIGIKTSRLGGKLVRRKPEFDDMARLAEKKGMSLFEAERMILKGEEDE